MLDTLGNLGDFIGGIAVVITLIYLAVQVRQNTLALKAASWQEVVAGAREAARFRSDPAIVPAWARGLSNYPNMSVQDISDFSRVITDEALFFQGVIALYRSRQLEESVYSAYLNWFVSILATPGGSEWWARIGRPIFVLEMVEEIDKHLDKEGIPDIRELPGLSAEDWPED
ncbi:MAG: hypothetical protein AB8B81_06510 [Halioglobus sp.]